MAIGANRFGGRHGDRVGIGRTGHRASPDVAGDAGRVGGPGRELSRWLGTGALPPEAEEPLRSLVELSGRLAATVAAQEGRVAGPAAANGALAAQVARLQRDLYGPRSEKRGKGSDAPSGQDGQECRRRGGRPGRRRDRGDSVGDTGLRSAERPRFPVSP